jgi:hypothetical protein
VCWWFVGTLTGSFCTTKPQAHPEDWEEISFRKLGKPSYLGAAV